MTAFQETLFRLRGSAVTTKVRLPKMHTAGRFCALLFCGAFLFGATGCRLNKPGSASFASVDISGHSPQQIQEAAGNVFREDGYSAFLGANGEMIFQKEGTRANNIGQNGMVGTYYGEQTLVRFVAQLVQIGSDSWRLQGQAYFVRNPGEFHDGRFASAYQRPPHALSTALEQGGARREKDAANELTAPPRK